MIWTTETPTKPGMYWWRADRDAVRSIVEVVSIHGCLEVCADWWSEWEYTDLAHGEWSSEPIPEPKEPS